MRRIFKKKMLTLKGKDTKEREEKVLILRFLFTPEKMQKKPFLSLRL